MARLLGVALAAILVLLVQDKAARAEAIALSALDEKVALETVDYLEAPSHVLTPEQIEAEWWNAFQPTGRDGLNRGFSSNIHWLRLEIINGGDATFTRWLEIGHARLERVSLFERSANGWRESATGTQTPRRDRPVVAATPVLPLTIPAGQTRTFLVRVQSTTAVGMAATIWEPLAFLTAQAQVQLLLALIVGAIGLAAVFSLLTFVLIRSPDHLALGLGLVFFALWEISFDGLATQYLWPAGRAFITPALGFWCSSGVICFLLFYRSFLDLPRHFPVWDKVCLVLAAMVAVGAACLDYEWWSKLNGAACVLLVGIGFVVGMAAHAKGFRAARWFLTGMAALWLSLLPNIPVVLAGQPASPLVQLSLPLTIAIASILTLVAVTDRVKELQQAQAQADALAITRLEEQVRERTRDLEEALGEAHAANRAKTDFLARVSHDLRTPLHTVIGYAQLIQRGSRRIPPKDGAGAIEGSARRLLALIDELLDYVRGEVGRLRMEPQPLYWHRLIERVVADARQFSEAAGNVFRFEPHGPFPAAIMVDKRRLRQVLDNLLSNANRHTRHGMVTLSVAAECNGDQAVRLNFVVQDTGSGIPPDKVDDIFRPFVSGSRSIGLGLAISRQLVAALGGELRLDHTSPQGSAFAFHVICPLAREVEVAGPEPVSRYSGYGGRRRTILVAEDIAENRRFICELLAEAGFDVVAVSTGREALDRMVEDAVDLVLTDQFMPDGDGWSVLRGVKEMAPELPVVLISAAPPNVPEGFPSDMVFSAVLLKPVDCDALLDTLGRLLSLDWQTGAPEDGAKKEAQALFLPDDDAEVLLRLVDAGDVTGIEEMADALGARGDAFADVADAVREAVARLDFQFLSELARAGQPGTT